MSSSSEFSLFCSGWVFKALCDIWIPFNPMEMFPLFVDWIWWTGLQSEESADKCSFKAHQSAGCDRSGHARICFDSSAPKVPKAPLRGIRNRGNRGASGLCVEVTELLIDWALIHTHSSTQLWLTAQQNQWLKRTYTHTWMKAGSCEASLHFSRYHARELGQCSSSLQQKSSRRAWQKNTHRHKRNNKPAYIRIWYTHFHHPKNASVWAKNRTRTVLHVDLRVGLHLQNHSTLDNLTEIIISSFTL